MSFWALVLASTLAAQPLTTTPDAPPLGARLAAQLRHADRDQTIRFLAEGLSEREVRAAGGRVRGRVGDVLSVEAPRRVVEALAPRARRLDAPQRLKPALDLSRVVVGADRVEFGDARIARTGAGVLVAFYDSGVDWTHPDFHDRRGGHRIRAWLDQDLGLECTPAVSCPESDLSGHGTHVASIAVGSGPQFRGMAPEAELLVVRSTEFTDLVEALAWFDRQRTKLDQPMVVNISLSGHEGPHDGTSLEARAIEELEALTVVAAGNDGDHPVHASAELDSEPQYLGVVLPAEEIDQTFFIEAWGRDPSVEPLVDVVLVRRGAIEARSSTMAPGLGGTSSALRVDGIDLARVELDAASGEAHPDGKPQIRVELTLFKTKALEDGEISVALELLGRGAVDVWIDAPATDAPGRFFASPRLGLPRELTGDSRSSLSELASAPSALAVSALSTRPGLDPVGSDPSTIADFSAHGPSLGPGDKPELAAPGDLVIAAHAAQAPRSRLQLGSLYHGARGTSLSAPHVAGAAALLLEARPGLSREALRGLLTDSARPLDDDRARAGALDAFEALEALQGSDGCRCLHAPTSPPFVVFLAAVGLLWRRRSSA